MLRVQTTRTFKKGMDKMFSLGKFKKAVLAVAAAASTMNKQYAEDVLNMEVAALTKNAFLGVVIMSVMSLVVGSVFLYIGIFVNAVVYNAIPTAGLDASDNTTLTGVKTNVNTAFTLGGIIMIVIGAAGIISVLLGMVPNQRAA
jgi:hypothetical protein